jgi:rod shape determining protein RodA
VSTRRNSSQYKGSTSEAIEGIDWTTVGLYVILVILGWVMVYAADYTPQTAGFFDMNTSHGKQTIFVGVAFVLGASVLLIDSRFFKTFAYFFYGFSILLLLVTLVLAPNINGAHAWLPLFGGFNLQTGEIAKFATALTLASFLGGYDTTLSDNRTLLYTAGIIFLPMIIILLQNDTGSMLVFLSFSLMLYREGMAGWIYVVGILFGVLAVITLMFPLEGIIMLLLLISAGFLITQFNSESRYLWVRGTVVLAVLSFIAMFFGLKTVDNVVTYPGLAIGVIVLNFIYLVLIGTIQYLNKKQQFVLLVTIGLVSASAFASVVNIAFFNVLQRHQQERIYVWLKPELCDPKGPLYNVNQSKIAIGSGGFTGKGFLHGSVTQMDYVPEQVTDFIFCTVGEEHGFIGSVALLALYVLLLLRVVHIGESQRSKFTRIYAYCVAGILFFHFTINIGMTMGMLPVIGIPLPFLSYGGSSLLSFTVLLAVLVKMGGSRSL